MTVYADSLFLINFTSNFILLTLSQKAGKIKIELYRKVLAAISGAVVSVILFCIDFNTCEAISAKLLTLCIITFICTGKRKNAFLRLGAVFIIFTHIYSGIFSQLAPLWGDAIVKNGFTYINMDIILFLFIFICTYPVVWIISKLINHRKRIYSLVLTHNGNSIELIALCDSGNLLKYKGRGVIVAEWKAVKDLFGFTEYEQLYEHIEDLKLSIIPYTSLGSEGKTLTVFECGLVTFKNEPEQFHNIPIGVINRTISPRGNYNALIGTEYIQ